MKRKSYISLSLLLALAAAQTPAAATRADHLNTVASGILGTLPQAMIHPIKPAYRLRLMHPITPAHRLKLMHTIIPAHRLKLMHTIIPARRLKLMHTIIPAHRLSLAHLPGLHPLLFRPHQT